MKYLFLNHVEKKYLTIDDLEVRDFFYQPNGTDNIVYNKIEKRWEYHVNGQLHGTMNHRASCPFDVNEPLIAIDAGCDRVTLIKINLFITLDQQIDYQTTQTSSCMPIWAELGIENVIFRKSFSTNHLII